METTYNHGKKTLDFINKQMDKKGLNNLLSQMYLEFGGAKTAELANSLKNLGYRYATKSGTTISIADLIFLTISLFSSSDKLFVADFA